jgi:3-oxoacyl-[acyl-carrier protein] reductase
MAAPGGALHGKLALVTGGGRGIGRAAACALAREGAAVAICARTQAELDQAAQAIHAAAGGAVDVLALRCDVAVEAEVQALAKQVKARLGDPAIVVNNAGVVARGRLDEQPLDEWRRVVQVNLDGTVLVTRAFLPAMRRAHAGRVINISSISGRQGTASMTAYCASKHAVIGLTRALAEEVRSDNVQVNAICPGSVDTRMLVASGYKPLMSADDVARVVRFLAVEAPPALTGASLDVFG